MQTILKSDEASAVQPRDEEELAKRKIAFFISCDSFEGFYGGTFGITREFFVNSYRNDFVWDYAHGLRKAGHPVVIYVLSYGAPGLYSTGDGLQVRFIKLARSLRPIDRLLWRLRSLPYLQALRAHVAYMGYGPSFQRALREDGIDVIYHQEVWSSRFDLIVGKVTIPIVGADHGAQYQNWMAKAKRRSFRNAAAITVQTAEGQRRAQAFGGKSIFLANGVDTGFFTPGDPEQLRDRTILAVGRLVEKQKRFADLLRALTLLPDFRITLVGSGPDESSLKNLAVELGLAQRVEFAGFISDKTILRQLYRTCGVFVSTSAWEAVALVLLEAMSCCSSVVATRIPSFEAMLTDGDDGLLVPVGSPEDLANAIRLAYDRRAELATKARATIQARFSSNAVFASLSTILEQV